MSNKIWVRLKPHNPAAGQMRLNALISPLNLRLEAGKFVEIPKSIWDSYLCHEQYEYPPYAYIYEAADYDQMLRIVKAERRAKRRQQLVEDGLLEEPRGMRRRKRATVAAEPGHSNVPRTSVSHQQREIRRERDYQAEAEAMLSREQEYERLAADLIDDDDDFLGTQGELHDEEDSQWDGLAEELNDFRGDDGSMDEHEMRLRSQEEQMKRDRRRRGGSSRSTGSQRSVETEEEYTESSGSSSGPDMNAILDRLSAIEEGNLEAKERAEQAEERAEQAEARAQAQEEELQALRAQLAEKENKAQAPKSSRSKTKKKSKAKTKSKAKSKASSSSSSSSPGLRRRTSSTNKSAPSPPA